MARAAISEEILMEATSGHVQRVGVTVESLDAAFIDLDVSPDEMRALLGALVGARDDGSMDLDRDAYIAGALDGFVLMLRAVRIAEERST